MRYADLAHPFDYLRHYGGGPSWEAFFHPYYDAHVTVWRYHQAAKTLPAWDYDPYLDDMDRFHEAEDLNQGEDE